MNQQQNIKDQVDKTEYLESPNPTEHDIKFTFNMFTIIFIDNEMVVKVT